MVTKLPSKRSPGEMLFDLRSVFQAGAVGKGPGPKFGRKPAQNRPKQNLYFSFLIYVLVSRVDWSRSPRVLAAFSRAESRSIKSPASAPGPEEEPNGHFLTRTYIIQRFIGNSEF